MSKSRVVSNVRSLLVCLVSQRSCKVRDGRPRNISKSNTGIVGFWLVSHPIVAGFCFVSLVFLDSPVAKSSIQESLCLPARQVFFAGVVRIEGWSYSARLGQVERLSGGTQLKN